MLEEIKGQWQLDEDGYIICQKVVDCPDVIRTELYKRAMDYIVSNYNDVSSVIQDRNVPNGIIVVKGVYKNVNTLDAVLLSNVVDTWHILKVEVKDGKARIRISLTQYEETVRGGEFPDNHYLYPISTQYPINPNGYQKDLYEQAFNKSVLKALETIGLVERALKGGTIKKKDEW
jgi:hypothetical protein